MCLNLENVFNKITGLKLKRTFLSSLPLSNGTTAATFAFSGNIVFYTRICGSCKYWG